MNDDSAQQRIEQAQSQWDPRSRATILPRDYPNPFKDAEIELEEPNPEDSEVDISTLR